MRMANSLQSIIGIDGKKPLNKAQDQASICHEKPAGKRRELKFGCLATGLSAAPVINWSGWQAFFTRLVIGINLKFFLIKIAVVKPQRRPDTGGEKPGFPATASGMLILPSSAGKNR
jgi:hypothetical protein